MRYQRLLLALCTVWLFISSSYGADPTGTIAGTVLDPSGAAVIGAKVTVTNVATGFTRDTQSAVDGGYLFPLLPVGTYSVAVEAAGFHRSEQKGIQVKADQSSAVSISLQIGATSETISVTMPWYFARTVYQPLGNANCGLGASISVSFAFSSTPPLVKR